MMKGAPTPRAPGRTSANAKKRAMISSWFRTWASGENGKSNYLDQTFGTCRFFERRVGIIERLWLTLELEGRGLGVI